MFRIVLLQIALAESEPTVVTDGTIDVKDAHMQKFFDSMAPAPPAAPPAVPHAKATRDKVIHYDAEQGKYGGSIIDSHGSTHEREERPKGRFHFKASQESRCDMGGAVVAGASAVALASLALHFATKEE